MLDVDLHVHTNKSPCGLHSLFEILGLARDLGMSMLAITDHDGGNGHAIRVLSYRFPKEWQGVHVLAGIEFSILDDGKLKLPKSVHIDELDICLAGFHPDSRTIKNNPKKCTDDLEAVLNNYPFIDIISHPTLTGYDLEHERCAKILARHGVAMEVNNSSLRYEKEKKENLLSLLGYCVSNRVPVAVNSDAHTAVELGQDEMTRPLLKQAAVPAELIINSSVDQALAFIDKRRANKKKS
jgi:putative hydrolase